MQMREFKGFFRTLPCWKKVQSWAPHSGSELSADFTPSTPAAHVDADGTPMVDEEAGNTWWQSCSGRWYLFGSNRTVWWDAPGRRGGLVCFQFGVHRQPRAG